MGHCEFELGNLMGSRKNMLILPLMDSKGVKQGDAVIRSEKVAKENYGVSFKKNICNRTRSQWFSQESN
jgi:hypothetical protein